MANFMDFLMGSPGKEQQFQRFTGEQQGALSQLLSTGLGGMQSQQSQFDFAPIAQQARTQFQQQTVPSIMERLTSMGVSNSGALPQLLSQAGAGLEENLAGMQSRIGLQQQGMEQQRLLSMLGMALQPQFESAYMPGDPGLLKGMAPGLGLAAGSYLPQLLERFGQGGAGNQQQQQQAGGQQGRFGSAISRGIGGATAGSAFGPIGTAVGGGLGALSSLFF